MRTRSILRARMLDNVVNTTLSGGTVIVCPEVEGQIVGNKIYFVFSPFDFAAKNAALLRAVVP